MASSHAYWGQDGHLLRDCRVPCQKMEQRTGRTTLLAELWKQVSRWVDRYTGWTLSANRPWKNFFKLGATKPTASQNYQNYSNNIIRAFFTMSRFLRWQQVHLPHHQTEADWQMQVTPLPASQIQEKREEKKDWKHVFHSPSPMPRPSLP